MLISDGYDVRLRQAAFFFLERTQHRTGGPVRYDDVASFEFEGQRIALMDLQRGIRKPKHLQAALSFRTVHAESADQRPYEDEAGADGYLRYKWRGTDPAHPENVALRIAQAGRFPLIWFQGIARGTYLPIFPVWLVEEEPHLHQFVVALDQSQLLSWPGLGEHELELRRRYAERLVKERLHQPLFRARVLHAYDSHCALCNFRHPELLDAAHIRADRDGGRPVVTNGISMCKIHHAAYDEDFLGIDGDYRVAIRPDLLAESDGPTLKHSLQALDQMRLLLPRQRSAHPNRDWLAERFERFKKAS